MPSQSSKSPLAPSTKTHSFLRKSTDESHSKTTSTSVPSEVRTSQSTNSLSPRSNESINDESDFVGEDSREFVNHPEDEDDIFDDDKSSDEKAAADLRASRRRGVMIPIHQSMKTIQASFREWDLPYPQLPH